MKKYQRAMNLLQDTDFMIAEMSQASIGQGMKIQEAIRLNIPILIIAKIGTKISSLMRGCKNLKNIIYYDNIDEIKDAILEFIERGK